MVMSRTVALIISIGTMVITAGVVRGQSYPNKPVRIVTGPAGSSSDATARLVAQGIAGFLGEQLIIDNRGSPILSAEFVSKAPPDGYTLLVAGGTFWTFPLLQKASYDPVRDFSPITVIEMSVNIIAVHQSIPVKSVKELIALAKAKPGELNYASGPTGSSSHLAPALFIHMAGVNIVGVPYKAMGQAVSAMLGGEVQLIVTSATVVAPHLKSGQLRGLAVTSAKPSVLFPDLPTAAVTVPGYESVGLTAIFAPAKTPTTVINRLNQDTARFLKTAEAKEKFLIFGAEPIGNSPEELAAVMKAEMGRLGKLINDIGIRAN